MKRMMLAIAIAAASAVPGAAAGSFSGKWTSGGQPCDDPDGTNHVTIVGNRLQWYEHRCDVLSARAYGSTRRYEANCRGEGRKWRDVLTLSLANNRLLINRRSDGRSESYTRCR